MSRTSKKYELVCCMCGRVNRPDKKKSTANWDVLSPTCDNCGSDDLEIRLAKNTKEEKWVISVSGYGDFFFEGTEDEAEAMRIHKVEWEGGIGRKRKADDNEISTKVIDRCKNHPNFNAKSRFRCNCEKCAK